MRSLPLASVADGGSYHRPPLVDDGPCPSRQPYRRVSGGMGHKKVIIMIRRWTVELRFARMWLSIIYFLFYLFIYLLIYLFILVFVFVFLPEGVKLWFEEYSIRFWYNYWINTLYQPSNPILIPLPLYHQQKNTQKPRPQRLTSKRQKNLIGPPTRQSLVLLGQPIFLLRSGSDSTKWGGNSLPCLLVSPLGTVSSLFLEFGR